MDEITAAIRTRFEEALALYKSGKIKIAQAICNEVLEVRRNEPHTLQLLGMIAISNHNYNEAITHLKESLLGLPNNPICEHNLASAYNMAGKFAEAEKHYSKVLALNPNYVEAYFNLVFITDLKKHKEIIDRIIQLLYQPNLPTHDRMLLHYAAGYYYHDQQNFFEAFSQFNTANEGQNLVFNSKEFQDLVAATIKTFNPDLFFRFKAAGDSTIQPIFIVGLPASGGILLDNLLCYHPEIGSIKTNTDFYILSKKLSQLRPGHEPYPECLNHLSHDQIKNLAKIYLEQLENHIDKRYVINSFLMNFLFVGLIKLLFPEAKIIHIKRQPEDACLACYFTLLQQHCEFSGSLENIFTCYQGYDALMKHWETQFPEDICTVSLENLLSTPEATLKNLLTFLQLPWDPSCVNLASLEKGCDFLPGFSSQYSQHTEALHENLTAYIEEYAP